MLGMYAALQTTLLHLKSLNGTETPIFFILFVQCFQGQLFYRVYSILTVNKQAEKMITNTLLHILRTIHIVIWK